MIRYFSYTVIFIVLAVSICFGQEIKIVHSDKLESFNNGEIVKLIGSVHLEHGKRELFSQFAQWNRRTGIISFRGNVEILDTAYTIESDFLLYRRADKTAQAKGSIKFLNLDSTLFVYGENGFYDGENNFVRLVEKPHLLKIDTAGSKLELKSKILLHFTDYKRSVAIDSVSVTLFPADTANPKIHIYCDSLEFHQDSNFVQAFGDVKIVQESLTVLSPRAIMWRDDDKILLVDGVSVKNPDWRMFADTLWVHLKSDKISNVLATGNPHGIWHDPADSFHLADDSRFSADTMKFTFGDKGIELVELVRQAKIEYSPAPTDTSVIDEHIASGDSIAAIMTGHSIDSVEIHGGVVGTSYQIKNGKRDSLLYRGDEMALTSQKRVHILANSWIKYGDMQLTAGKIDFDGETKVLVAKPIYYSADSIVGKPFLKDKNDSLHSDELEYNVDTKIGILSYGHTAADKGFFTGQKIAKTKGDTFYIQNATFTTCDRKPPHYHFFTPELKLIPKDKAIVRPVTMFVGRLPVFWLPFFVFSVKTRRHSGLLTFDIGKFQRGERFIRNLGYYWAPSQYFDLYGALDIDENNGIYVKGQFRYALRYYLSGRFYGSYKLTSKRDWETGLSKSKRWEIQANHQETLGEKAKFSGTLSLVSDADYLLQTHENPQERMQRSLRSYASFSQGFSWGSFSASADRTDDLDNNTTTLYLPKISVRKYSGSIFGDGDNWYNKFYYSAGSNFVGYSRTDSTDSTERHYGDKTDCSLNFSHSIGDYLTLSPSLSASGVIEDKGVDGKKFPAMFSYSLSAGASTDLYGNIPLGLFGVKFFHHIISPSVSFSYSPKISGGENFYSFGGISAPASTKRMSMNINISQQFGLKKVDSTNVVKRISLFNTSTSFSYNFLSDAQKFSDINSSLNANPSSWLSVSVSLTHTLYSNGSTQPNGLFLRSANMNSSVRWKFNIPFASANSSDTSENEIRDCSINISHYLSKNIESGAITHWIKYDIKTFITPNWRIDYNYYYDVENSKKISDEFHLWRDLHCWEILFIWVPSGVRAGYYFKINVKEIPEIKIEKTSGNVRWR